MKRVSGTILFGLIFCLFSGPVLGANDLIYNNTTYDPYDSPIPFSEDDELIDFGYTNGGKIAKFVFQYASYGTYEDVIVRFYKNTSINSPGTLFKTFWLNVPPTYGSVRTYEYAILKSQQFVLPAGNFGYSFEFPSSGNYAIMQAWGGSGNVNAIWAYYMGSWGLYGLSGYYAGFYMQLYLPIDEVTCDIKGYKFNDLNGDGEWDGGEPVMPGWEVYLDLNHNGQKDAGEPNSVTNDPNGMYFFENLDSPAVYTIRENMKSGWTQTLPGGPDYAYILDSEPNHVYRGYHFGNTDQVVLKYGGGDGSEGDPYRILTAAHMNQIGLHQEDWGSHFILMNNIDMSGIPGEQYNIIGYHISSTDYLHFTGVFNGNHHTIQNFRCTTAPDAHYVGLFGYTENAQIYDLTMSQAVVHGGSMVGALVAYQMGGTLTGCHVEADVTGDDLLGGLAGGGRGGQMTQCSGTGTVTGGDQSIYLGGLIGWAREAAIQNCHTSADVTGGQECEKVGGFVGWHLSGSLSDCYSTGSVSVGDSGISIGGLIGEQSGASVSTTRCYSSAAVTTGSTCQYIGGLIGMFFFGTVTQCYSTGDVASPASEYIGGLVGVCLGDLLHSYCTGDVAGSDGSKYVGGFAGQWGGGLIQYCFSTGAVGGEPAGDYRGGFCAFGYGTNHCFWDRQTSGQLFSAGAKGRTTEQMQQAANYINWNKTGDTIWEIQEGTDYPHLIWEGTGGTALETDSLTNYLDGQGTGAEPFQIHTPEDLNMIGLFPEEFDKEYELCADLDLSSYEGMELNLIGFNANPFSGYFHGNGFHIRRFTYVNECAEATIGLFRIVSGTVENLHMDEVMISAGEGHSVGGLAGVVDNGTLLDCSVSGSVSVGNNSEDVGGLSGSLSSEAAADGCSSRAEITAGDNADDIGGLFGSIYSNAALSNSSYVGSVTVGNETNYAGGLAGSIWGNADSCFSLGSVAAGNSCLYVGGFAGYCGASGEANYCYSRTSVAAGDSCQYVGGLIGRVADYVRYCYSTGAVSTGQYPSGIGGLIGTATYTSRITYSYWDTQTSGLTQSSGGNPRTTEQMMQQATYASWNFSTIWQICEGMNYPRLQSHPSHPADLFCPDGVELNDLNMMADEWLVEELDGDMAPDGGDGFVDLLDWNQMAVAWMTTPASANWDAACDIAPAGGDDVVDLLDLTSLADSWLTPSAMYCDIAPAPNGILDAGHRPVKCLQFLNVV
jgi:hypothetical protein